MSDAIIRQGRFTSTGAAKNLVLRNDVDWIEVINITQMAAQQNPGRGVQFFWQRGMAQGSAIEIKKANAADTLNGVVVASGGFTLIDTSNQAPGALDATVAAVSNANPPVVTVADTTGLSVGDVVRMIDVAGAQQLGGIDFTIGNGTFTGTTFSLDYMTQIVAGTTGSFRRIPYNPIFYPPHRFISSITQAQQAVVLLTVDHEFTVGQQVRFVVPEEYGMVEMNGLSGTIVAVDTVTTNTITVDIDTTAFTAFAFPLTGDYPFSPALVVPIGEAAKSPYENLLDDARRNIAYIGIQLAGGAQSPAGSAGDVIYWRAGSSFDVDNQ